MPAITETPSMPNAIPADAAAQLPPARMIDPRGHRFGAAVSAVLLIVGIVTQVPLLVFVSCLSIASSAAFGLKYSIYGFIWRRIVRFAGLGPVEPEHEYPPRFAQVLGSIALTLSLTAFIVGAPVVAWGLAGAVAALQSLLAVTGYCLGCRLYFLRWWVPDVATRLWTGGRIQRVPFATEPIRYS